MQSPQLVKKKEDQPLTVNQFQFSGWDKNAATPTSRGSLMTLLEMVERSQIKTGNHAVVIHCMYVYDTSVSLAVQNGNVLLHFLFSVSFCLWSFVFSFHMAK